MLTPAQVKNHQFSANGRGHYRADEVDDFFAEVCESYDQMFKENGELVRKIGMLADKVEEYRNDEDNIRAALLTAQRMADKIVKEARETTENEVSQAKQQAEALVAEATERANAITEEAEFNAKERTVKSTQEAQERVAKASEQAEQVLAEAKAAAQAERKSINGKAQAELEEIRHAVSVEKTTLEKMRVESGEFKENIVKVCKDFAELIERIPSLTQAELDKKREFEQELKLRQAQEEEARHKAQEAAQAAQAEAQQAQQAEQAAQRPEPAPVAEQPKPAVQEEPEEEETQAYNPQFFMHTAEEPQDEDDYGDDVEDEESAGFRLRLDNIDKTAPISELTSVPREQEAAADPALKFGPDYDVFSDEDEDEDDDYSAPNLSFRNFFKK